METDEDLNTWIMLFQVEVASEQICSMTDVVQSSSLLRVMKRWEGGDYLKHLDRGRT